MTIIDKLASTLGRRDEVPNQELAKEIVAKADTKSIQELVENLANKNKNIQSDCIKVLDEIGERKPGLISKYTADFIDLLTNGNNRLQWGAMAVLNVITNENPKGIYAALPKIIAAADNGTIITRDNCVAILIKLCSIKAYADSAFALLNEQLLRSAANQLPMYAENALPVINEKYKPVFIKTLTSRLGDFEKETKRKRVEKVLNKLRSK